jgi:hypothetical protein
VVMDRRGRGTRGMGIGDTGSDDEIGSSFRL